MTGKNPSAPTGAAHSADGAPQPRRGGFPTLGDLALMLGIILVMQLAAGLLLSGAAHLAGIDLAAPTPREQGIVLAATYLCSMLPAWLLTVRYRRLRGDRGSLGRFGTKGLRLRPFLGALVVMIAAGILCEPLFELLPAPPSAAYGRGVWSVASLVVAAPLIEELICRGTVLESLRTRYGAFTAWWGSALFFGVLHLHPTLALNAAAIGLILGYTYLKSGTLWMPVLLHAANNAAAYLLLVTGHEQTTLRELTGGALPYALIYTAALIVTAAAARRAVRMLRRPDGAEEKRPAA